MVPLGEGGEILQTQTLEERKEREREEEGKEKRGAGGRKNFVEMLLK